MSDQQQNQPLVEGDGSIGQQQPSKLERLRAKVHSSRQRVVESKKTVQEKFSLLQQEWDSIEGASSSQHSRTTASGHPQENDSLQEQLERIQMDREKLQNELSNVRDQLDVKNKDLKESQEKLAKSHQEVWEEKLKSLESINQALKEQSVRDLESKNQLATLCEELEQRLEEQQQQQQHSDGDYAEQTNQALADLYKELKEAKSRQVALQREADFYRNRHEEVTNDARKKEESLQRELDRFTGVTSMKKRYGNQTMPTLNEDQDQDQAVDVDVDDGDGNGAGRKSLDDETPTVRSGNDIISLGSSFQTDDDTSMFDRIQDFENVVNRLSMRVRSLESENVELASTGSSAVQGLQEQIATMKSENEEFAKMGEAVVTKLQFKIATLKTLLSGQVKARKQAEAKMKDLEQKILVLQRGEAEVRDGSGKGGNSPSVSTLSRQIAESNANFAALEEKVSELRNELLLASEETHRGMDLLDQKEKALEEAKRQNQSLVLQLETLEDQLNRISSSSSKAADEQSEVQTKLLEDLQDAQEEMDMLTEEVANHRRLLIEEKAHSLDLSQQVQNLKNVISILEGKEGGDSESDFLSKIKTFQIKIDDLITEVNENRSFSPSDSTDMPLSQQDATQLLIELKEMQAKAKACILILEKSKGEDHVEWKDATAEEEDEAISAVPEMRIRITNEDSGRTKELVLPISEEINLFDAIYDDSSVKNEGVRKWSNQLAQLVQENLREIQCVLLDPEGQVLWSFSIDALKETTTDDIDELIPNPNDPIQLVLRCGRPGETTEDLITIRTTNSITGRSKSLIVPLSEEVMIHDAVYGCSSLKCSKIRHWPDVITENVKNGTWEIKCLIMDADGNIGRIFSLSRLKRTSTKQLFQLVPGTLIQMVLVCQPVQGKRRFSQRFSQRLSSETDLIPGLTFEHGDRKRAQRQSISIKPNAFQDFETVEKYDSLSYTHIKMTNEVTNRSQEIVLPISEQLNVFDSVYESDNIRQAGVRKWPNDIVKAVDKNLAEVYCVLLNQERDEIRSFSIPELNAVSINDLCELSGMPDGIQLCLRYRKVSADNNLVQESNRASAKRRSTFNERGVLQYSLSLTDLRIRITNETTNRFKDLVVPISSELSLCEATYNSEAVKAARVRKWPNEVAQNVKNKICEIRCVLLDNNGNDMRSFSINEFEKLSTETFCKMAEDPLDLVNIVLRCQNLEPKILNTVVDLQAQIDDLKSEGRDLTIALDLIKKEKAEIEKAALTEARTHRQSMDAVTAELAMSVANTAMKEIQLEDTMNRLSNLKQEKNGELQALNEKISKLETQLENSRSKSMDLSLLEIAGLKVKVQELETANKKLQMEIEKSGQEKLPQIQEGLVEEKELEDLKARLEEATLKIRDLEKSNERLTLEVEETARNQNESPPFEAVQTKKTEEGESTETSKAAFSLFGMFGGADNAEKSKPSRILELEAANARLQEQLESGSNSDLLSELNSYKSTLQQERHLISCMSTELYDSNARESQLRKELDRLEALRKDQPIHTTETPVQIVEAEAEYAGEVQDLLQSDLDSANAKNQDLSKQIEELQKQVESHERKELEYKQIMEKDEEMKSSISSLTSILERVTVANKALTARTEELESEITSLKFEKRFLKTESSDADQTHKLLAAEVSDLKASLQEETTKKNQLESALEQKEQMLQDLQQIARDDGNIKERNKDVLHLLEKSHLREGAIQAKYNLCSSELDKLKESFKAQVDGTVSKLALLEKEVEEEKSANELFKSIITKLNRVNENIEEKNVKKSKEVAYLKAQNKALSKVKVGVLQRENFTLTEEVAFLRDQKAKFVDAVKKLERRVEKLVKEIGEGEVVRKSLEARVSELEQGTEKTSSLEAQVQDLSQQLIDLQEEHSSASEEAQAQEKKLIQEALVLEQALDDLRQKLGDPLVREKTDALITKVKEGEAKNRKLTKERDDLRRDLNAVNSQMKLIKSSLGDFGW